MHIYDNRQLFLARYLCVSRLSEKEIAERDAEENELFIFNVEINVYKDRKDTSNMIQVQSKNVSPELISFHIYLEMMDYSLSVRNSEV